MSNLPLQLPALIYLGANAHDELERQLLAINPSVKFVESAIYPERQLSRDSGVSLSGHVVRFDSDLCGKDGEILFSPILNCNQINIINSIMDDKLLPLLWTRFGGRQRWLNRGETKRYEATYSLIKAAIDVCQKLNPKIVIFSYEPHMLPMYVFKKVCQLMGIQTFTMVISPFIWRVFLKQESSDGGAYRLVHEDINNDRSLDESVTRFIVEKSGDYSRAKPFYEKRTDKLGSFRRLLYKVKANDWKPHKVILSQRALIEYRRLVTPRNLLEDKQYICMFLQLQPEQTTLPDGGLFADQLVAIQMLYAAAKKLNLSLVIREHPATFESANNQTWRPFDFYSTIKGIGKNIYFDDLDADPYSLIKSAKVVSAITGTVLLEGLLQGRPAVAFGRHPMEGYSNVSLIDNFANERDLADKIHASLSLAGESVFENIQDYLHTVYPKTFGLKGYVGNAGMSLELLRKSRYEALDQIAMHLLTKQKYLRAS